MLHARLSRALVATAAISLLAVSCGQKPGVHVEASGPGTTVIAGGGQSDATGGGTAGGDAGGTGTGTADGATGGTDSGTGSAGAGAGDAGAGQGGTDSGAAGGGTGGSGDTGSDGTGGTDTGGSGGTSGGDSGGDAGGGTGGGGAQQRTPTGTDRTGVTDTTINIGLHAPVTGAANIPSTSFEKAGDLYWDYIIEGQGQQVLGRSEVALHFRDDQYDPAAANQVCRELFATTFTVVGGGGTDQIQACGRSAGIASVPYFSAGVTENGLEDNAWYFAASMTYRQQGVLLAQYVARNFAGQKTAAIVTQTPNFDDAVAGWEQGVADNGVNYYDTLRHSKGDSSWYTSFVNDLKANEVEVVYILSSPLDYIRLANKAAEQNYSPRWVGVGISKGLNAVLENGCPAIDKGIFFSPFPGLDWARQNVPEFFEAGSTYGKPTDDISLALWGIARQMHEMLNAYEAAFGTDLTREDFRALTETLNVSTGVFPDVNFAQNGHFGGTGVHVLEADCSVEEYKTLDTFKSSF